MMRLLLFMLVIVAAPCYAQEVRLDKYSLMKQAVEYSTKADAYNAYCDEPTKMSSEYLDRFYLDDALSVEQKDVLATIMKEEVEAFLAWLKKDQPVCDDVEFMLGRLEVMRKLKDVSYQLNGVDPATLPQDDIPEGLMDLLPSKQGMDGILPQSD